MSTSPSQNKNNDTLFLEDLAPWNENSNPIWLASTLLVHRNIEKFNFPPKLDLERRKQIVSLIGKEMNQMSVLKKPRLLKSEECSPLDKEFLIEHCLTHEGFLQASQGEAFIFDKHGSCLISINIDDHIHLHFIDVKGELEKGWGHLTTLETTIGKSLAYSYSPKFGFLTSNPFICGTGLVVSLFMQLSGLIHTGNLKGCLDKIKEDNISITSLLGTEDDYVGDLVVINNQYALGINEETTVSTMRNFAARILNEEERVRELIKQDESADIKDKVARAFGILIHSYQIETVEALNEIALLKLGVEMGWLQGISVKDLNKLFFSCRRAHLLRGLKDIPPLEKVGHQRAEFIHKALKNVTLTI